VLEAVTRPEFLWVLNYGHIIAATFWKTTTRFDLVCSKLALKSRLWLQTRLEGTTIIGDSPCDDRTAIVHQTSTKDVLRCELDGGKTAASPFAGDVPPPQGARRQSTPCNVGPKSYLRNVAQRGANVSHY